MTALPPSPYAGRGLGDLLPAHAASRPGAIGLRVVGGADWTWAQLASRAGGVQAGLHRLGVGHGDMVALMCDNSAEVVAALCAITGMGAIAVPINAGLMGDGLAHVLADSAARVVIADPVYLERCAASPGLPTGTTLIATPTTTATPAPRGQITAGAAWNDHFGAPAMLQSLGRGGDAAMILYTSGTTGRSKGAVVSHACVLAAIEASAKVMFEATPADVLYTCLPLFHCAGQRLGMWTALRAGAPLVLARGFSASGFWDELRRYGVTKFHFLGPLLSILWKAPPNPRDPEHPARLAVGGGPRLAWREFEERFNLTFVETYGMTETFGGCVSHGPRSGRAGSVGHALAHVEVMVADAEGRPVAPGVEGEIRIRPRWQDAIFSGYHRRPDLTAESMVDGWFRTGDLGVLDAAGYLSYRARLKDIIRRRGENVAPAEIEEAILQYPGVADCAVAGVPADIGEEEILAVVVPAASPLDGAALGAFLRTRLAPFAVPRFLAFAAQLPKTATGRVQRHELKVHLAGAHDLRPARATASMKG